jgi:hypothetical protein
LKLRKRNHDCAAALNESKNLEYWEKSKTNKKQKTEDDEEKY